MDLSLSRLLVIAVIVGIVFGGAILLKGDVLLRSSGSLIAVLVGAFLAFYVLDVITRRAWKGMTDAELSGDAVRIEGELFDDSSQAAGVVGQPRVLDYRTPSPLHRRRRHPLAAPIRGAFEVFKFCLGIMGGIMLSLMLMEANIANIELVVSLVVLTGILCLFFRHWRAFGVGLILSLPLGVLIFWSICFGLFK